MVVYAGQIVVYYTATSTCYMPRYSHIQYGDDSEISYNYNYTEWSKNGPQANHTTEHERSVKVKREEGTPFTQVSG